MKEIILAYQGEMTLKGLNRSKFEARLAKSIRYRLEDLGKFKVTQAQSTVFIEPLEDDLDMDEAFRRISKIFGIVKMSRAACCSKDFDEICATAEAYLGETLCGIRTFKVEAKRADKTFPMKSPELCRELGAYLLGKHPHLRVNVHEPQLEIMVEIRDKGAYIHGPKVEAAGGLPVGTSGRALNLLSGGIDSAVTAVMYADILGPENILLLNLPSRFNSAATRNSAQQLAQALGANYAVMPISESYELTVKQLEETPITHLADGSSFNLQLSGLIKENIQARDRGARVIAAASAAFGGAFSCNSNKAELAIGYATFYGDICGAMAMIGDLWKHQVYALGRYLNEVIYKREVIPEAIFNIRPSAELSDAQTVGNGGDPLVYAYHDYLLRAFIENWHKTTPTDILRWYKASTLAAELGCTQEAIDEACPDAAALIADLERWWKLFAGFAVAKRIQAPPVLSLTKRAFGYDHREAQLTPYFSREYYELKEELLK